MEYYRITDDLDYLNRWFLKSLNVVEEGRISVWKFVRANLIEGLNNETIKINLRGDGVPLDFTFADFGVIIVNEKIAKLFKKNTCQIFPVEVLGKRSDEKYYVINILNSVLCLDESKSDYGKFEKNDPIRPDKAGKYKFINRIVLDKDKIDSELEIFRLQNYEVVIVISEGLKNELEKLGCTGIKFLKIT